MYIEERYWGEYIGGSDDSLTLLAHLCRKTEAEVPLEEVLNDFGIPDLFGEAGKFRQWEEDLTFTDGEGWELSLTYAIGLILDLAALLLESRADGGVDLTELCDEEPAAPDGVIALAAAAEELEALDRILADFEESPMDYDLAEMVSEEYMEELAALAGALRRELCEAAG